MVIGSSQQTQQTKGEAAAVAEKQRTSGYSVRKSRDTEKAQRHRTRQRALSLSTCCSPGERSVHTVHTYVAAPVALLNTPSLSLCSPTFSLPLRSSPHRSAAGKESLSEAPWRSTSPITCLLTTDDIVRGAELRARRETARGGALARAEARKRERMVQKQQQRKRARKKETNAEVEWPGSDVLMFPLRAEGIM